MGLELKAPSIQAQHVMVCVWGGNFANHFVCFCKTVFLGSKKHRKHNKSHVLMTADRYGMCALVISTAADAPVSYWALPGDSHLGWAAGASWPGDRVCFAVGQSGRDGEQPKTGNFPSSLRAESGDDRFTFSLVQCFHVSCCLKYSTDAPNIRPVCSNGCTCFFFFCRKKKVDTECVSISLFI